MLLAVVVLYIAAAITMACLVFRSMDYSKLAPRDVFRRVWRRPLPPDVRRITFTGHGAGQGHNVWMRIDAPEQTLAALVGHSPPITATEFCSGCSGGSDADAVAVGWNEVRFARRPLSYGYDATEHGQGWYGVMAEDKSHNRLYLFAEVL